MATSRFSFVSRARYTSPMPPLPRRPVISSEPSRVPTSTDIGISMEDRTAFAGHYAEKQQRKQTQQRGQLQEWIRNNYCLKLPPFQVPGNRRTFIFPTQTII